MRIRSTLASLCLALAALAAPASPALASSDVVISQVWAGGNSTGIADGDFVELFNRTASPVSMVGWSLQVAAATGTAWIKRDLIGTIQPYSYYLVRVQNPQGGTPFTPDETFNPISASLLTTSGKVALRASTVALTGNCPLSDSSQNSTILDFVGIGVGAVCFEGAAGTPNGFQSPSPGGAQFRRENGCADSDNNAADFVIMTPQIRSSTFPSPGPCVLGACCKPTPGACSVTTPTSCTAASGDYRGDGTSCSPNPCIPNPDAVCCRGVTCSITSAAACTASGTVGAAFLSGNPGPCNTGNTTPCCHADFNKIEGITVQDIFDFLNAWFAASPFAKVGGDGSPAALSVQDIFDFLNIWFAGGC